MKRHEVEDAPVLSPEEVERRRAAKIAWAWLDNYHRTVGLVRSMSEPLILARCEGRWSDAVPAHYHAHYTGCLLRMTGVEPHYGGGVTEIPVEVAQALRS